MSSRSEPSPLVVLTIDQRDSRRRRDEVPALLARLGDHPVRVAFERTVGDEVQGVPADAAAAVAVLVDVLADGGWNVGVGVGSADHPLPASTREARGDAFLAARTAVSRAKSGPHHVSVAGAVPATAYRARQVETVLWLLAAVLERRTERGREVAGLLAQGLTHTQAAERLGITQSAVSQRAQAAGIVEETRARELAVELLEELLDDAGPGAGS